MESEEGLAWSPNGSEVWSACCASRIAETDLRGRSESADDARVLRDKGGGTFTFYLFRWPRFRSPMAMSNALQSWRFLTGLRGSGMNFIAGLVAADGLGDRKTCCL